MGLNKNQWVWKKQTSLTNGFNHANSVEDEMKMRCSIHEQAFQWPS